AFAGVVHHRFGSRVQPTGGHQLPQNGYRDAARRLRENSGSRSQKPDSVPNLVIAGIVHPATGTPHHLEGERAGGRVSNVERLRDSGRLHWVDEVGVVTQRSRNWIASE